MKRLVFLGQLGPILFWIQVLIVGWIHPNYSHIQQFISELGAKEAPFSWMMNYLGILPFGMTIILFSLSLFQYFRWAVIGLFLCGTLFIGAALFQCDVGCQFDDMSLEAIYHNFSAFLAFILSIIGSLLIGLFYLFKPKYKVVRIYSILSGVLGILLFWLIMKFGVLSPYRGLVQRLFLINFSLWLFLVSWHFQKASSISHHPAAVQVGSE